MKPEDIEQMKRDREAGTPGPWHASETWRPPIGNGPHSNLVNGNVFWGYSVSGSNEHGGLILPTLAAVHNFPDQVHANARRIARVPALESEVLRLREALEDMHQCDEWGAFSQDEVKDRARAALNGDAP